jgi:CxxC motif-containing protein (DUF1111 family)
LKGKFEIGKCKFEKFFGMTRHAILLLFFLAACRRDDTLPTATVEADEQYAGGANATTFDFGGNAFGASVRGLTAEEDGFFVTGNSFFRANWVTAPASVQSLDGLGPMFNAISCGSCHFKDGRAAPPATPDAPPNGLLFRLSLPGFDTYGRPLGEPTYGGQLQDKAILGVQPEAKARVAYEEIAGQYTDGTPYSLRRPVYEFRDWANGMPATGWLFSPRIAQQMPGLGLLEIVAESDILAVSDENDANGDGISGRPNYVWNAETQSSQLGRFGWKANQPNLRQQTASAFNGDIGITSSVFPQDHLTPTQLQQYPNVPNGGSPEISDDLLRKVVSYVQTLAVPARRQPDDATVLRGKYFFQELQCAACHRPTLTTGQSGSIAALRGQKIWPYTDLLLHDLGPELADGRPDHLATGSEWRTPPLWGLGLIETVNGHTFLLHDGRARNAEEAILWHGGEAAKAREGFKKLSAEERGALLLFLESL